MWRRQTRHLAFAVVATTASAALIVTQVPAQAFADIVVNLPVVTYSQPITIDNSGNVSLPVGPSGEHLPSQCSSTGVVDTTGITGTLCVGGQSATDPVPLDVSTNGLYTPVVKTGGAAAALNWMVGEGTQVIRGLYDVPMDPRINMYARGELRAYMANRLVQIADKKIAGEALTSDEQKALDFLQAQIMIDDRQVATAAFWEHQAYLAAGCGYHPPAPPPGVPNPVTLPEAVVKYCNTVAGNNLGSAFEFAPPIPSVADFTAWGAYEAAADELAAFTSDQAAWNAKNMTNAWAMIAGALTAVVGAAGLAALAGVSTTVALGAAAIMGSTTATIGLGSIIPGFATAFASVGVGAIASIAAPVIICIVGIVFSTWQLINHESVGYDLNKAMTDAQTETDALGLRENDPATFHSDVMLAKIASKVLEWTTIDSSGQAVSDPTEVWPHNETTADDLKFVVTKGNNPPQTVSSISVPQEGGVQTVRFNRGWFVVKPQGQLEQGSLTFGYVGSDGNPHRAMRASEALGGGWLVTDKGAGNAPTGARADHITYQDVNDGELTELRILPPALARLAGPRPSAVGPLLAGRPVILRPNAVETSGAAVDPASAQSDYTWSWTVTRLDPATAQWEDVTTSSTFGPSFIPTKTGNYQARVTMASVVDPSQKRYGSVDFPVTAPPIRPGTFALVDNGLDQLEVDLQVTEPVPTDQLTVKVTWPSDIGADTAPTQTITQDCIQTDPLECTTPRTGLQNNLVHAITPATDLREPVTVTVTNQYGGTLTRDLPIDNPDRPKAGPPPVDPTNAVSHDGTTTQLTIPLQAGNVDHVVASLVPGTTGNQEIQIANPNNPGSTVLNLPLGIGTLVASIDGNELHVFGNTNAANLGDHQIPIVLEQLNGTRGLLMLLIHVVPSTGDRFRGGLQSDIDPLNNAVTALPTLLPSVYGGRAEWEPYSDEMCVSLQRTNAGPSQPVSTCGVLSEFFTPDGEPRPFPYFELFPTGLDAGTYQAKAWLTQTDAHVDITPLTTSFALQTEVPPPNDDPQSALGDVTITGTPTVGMQLTANVGASDPADLVLARQWKADDVPIDGATAASYTPNTTDVGKRITVEVTGTKTGWKSSTKTSAPTDPVSPATTGIVTLGAVSIAGVPEVGRQLTARVGTSNPADVTLSYQWRRDGSAITNATSRIYTPTVFDLGHRLTVRATGRKTGWTSATRTSPATSTIAPGHLTLTPTPTITGRARVGNTLTVSRGNWGPGVTTVITWLADDRPIARQVGTQLRLTASQLGKRIKVRVTGLRPGYLPVTRTSTPTARVTR